MGRRDGVRMGTVGGCLLDGCLVVLVLLLVCVIGLWVWLATADDCAGGKARADMRNAAETRRERLAGAAADGLLNDSEIAQVFPEGKPAHGLVGIERDGPDLTVTAELVGTGPGVFLTSETFVTGCFTFEVALEGTPKPAVTVRELAVENQPQSACTTAGVLSPSPFPSEDPTPS
ncbi:hypothetical protein [Streptomyces sp. NBC_01185]|uniref:hypothetical protein n=1 Tax=Streptomyces sp. NBC_01185 TaxID=2903764 RepID=UPI00386C6679|nr:hypothetical protein OG770_24265 [Streptomyces sp. NBC_01185]